MRPEDISRFPAEEVELRNGAKATLRALRLDDGESLAAFYDVIPKEDEFFYCPHPLDREHAIKKAADAESPHSVCVVLEAADGSIAGYAWYQWKEEDSPKSSFGICLRRDHQGAGAGRMLIRRIVEISREIGPPVMALTVQKANPRAFELYKSFGWRVIREQLRREDGEPEYRMERETR